MGKRLKRSGMNQTETQQIAGQSKKFVQDFNALFSGLSFVGSHLRKGSTTNKYKPHQGVKECRKRKLQMHPQHFKDIRNPKGVYLRTSASIRVIRGLKTKGCKPYCYMVV